ncbi:hypothetical protein B0H13DRAFT_2429621 [Mycena leptocephala]|nr:hypothetical protein B0H13DRAFT_2429621 [Mycena leptocephala]
MNNPGTPGLRLLSLDGGGIRGLSMLIILEDLMWKLKVVEDLPDLPRPCDYFDLIGGTSTGGLIALMLGRLRMSVKDAVKAYGELSKEVFSNVKSQGSNGRFKASKLEKTMKGIVGAHSASQDPEEGMEDTRDNPCKVSVQRILSRVPMLKEIFNLAMDCTIWQAGRATSAAPTFFKQIRIGSPGIEEAFIDGGMGQNNPIAALLLEAQVMFPDRQIACIISLGTGQPHTIKIPKPSLLKRVFPLDVIEAIKGIAMDCEKQHQLSAHHFDPVPHVYFRFNVERGMQDIQLNQWERLGDVAANTRQYLLSHPIQNQLVDAVKSLVEKIGRVSTQSLSKISLHMLCQLLLNSNNSTLLWLLSDVLLPPGYSRDIGERQIYVLHGLGGSGKTQIALKFLDMISRHQPPRFTKQFFINASSLQTLDTALKNIAISHKIGQSSEDGLLWLISQREEWVLLFDNADDPSIDLFHFFPKCTHGNIIITSRNPQLAVHGPRSHSRVGDMNETDAIELLLLSAVKEKTIESAQSASEIVKVFYLQHSLRHNHVKLLSQHSAQSHDDYRWTVYTTWQISFEQLSKAAASIPESIFEHAAKSSIYDDEQEAQTLQEARKFLQNFLSVSGTWDPQQFMDIIAEIQGYTLIDRHNISDTLSIHPLVHSWCQHTLDDEPVARECMADIMGMSINLTEDAYLFRIGLMPHIDPLIQDRMTIKVYFDSGRFREAEYLEFMVLEKWKQLLGADHPDTLSAMANLAATYRELGRYQEAEPLESIVLEKRKQLLGADHPDMLTAMANLAATYCELGRYQEAEPLESTVLEKRNQAFGADHPDTLSAMANLATTYHQLGRYQEAEPLDSIVLEKQKQLIGADHPDTLLAMGNLATTYRTLGRYQEAELLDATVLEKRKQLLGADHPDTLRAMENLAGTYRELGRYQVAEPLEVIVLEQRKQVLGADHPATLLAMANLAATYRELGRYQEAEQLESIVLEKQKQLLGADHPGTLLAMANLATTYYKLGRYQEAEPLESIVLEKQKQVLGAGHPRTVMAMGNLAATYRELGRYQEAEYLEAQYDELVGNDSGDSEA